MKMNKAMYLRSPVGYRGDLTTIDEDVTYGDDKRRTRSFL